MLPVHDVASVRAAEEAAFAVVPDGALMQRAARALAVSSTRLLIELRGGAVGARVVLLIGSGSNGGDALWAGSLLAARGCRVDALLLTDRAHEAGLRALLRTGGHRHRWNPHDPDLADLVGSADLVLDGIVGIGGSGGLRADAADLVDLVEAAESVVVAVDVPSGVDADTGVVAGRAVTADVTVTFGSLKPGLVVAPGRIHAGSIQVVDIGLDFAAPPTAEVTEGLDAAVWVEEPAEDSYKYRRGVVGVAAGSVPYPGAALLVTAGARHGNVGMVRYLDRADGNAAAVVGHFPDTVIDGSPPADQQRVTAWACGSGFPGDHLDELTVLAVLESTVPVVLDAGALRVVASSADVRGRLAERRTRGEVTVLTPHEGEFEALRPGLLGGSAGRLAAASVAATELGAVVVLKGPGTVIAAPGGHAYVDVEGTSDLGAAGSGDVLSGLLAAVLAGAWSEGRRGEDAMARAAAAAVWLHGRAGQIAARQGPVAATDIAAAVRGAIRSARFGEDA